MKIYMYLQDKKTASVSEIVSMSGLKQPTISYHLKEMEEQGLLASKKTGKEVYYQIGKGCENCILKHA